MCGGIIAAKEFASEKNALRRGSRRHCRVCHPIIPKLSHDRRPLFDTKTPAGAAGGSPADLSSHATT